MIKYNKNFPECTAIDTETWLTETLGKPIELPDAVYDADWSDEAGEIIKFLADKTGVEYKAVRRDNVYNHENSFSNIFVYEIFAPVYCRDWAYADDIYVSVSVHRGGDARVNYGRTRLYKIDCIGETNFFDWSIGWCFYTLTDDFLEQLSGKTEQHYSSYPWGELTDVVNEKTIKWSDKYQCFLGRRIDGDGSVKIFADYYVS